MFDDFKPKFKWQLEKTFWLHLIREFIITYLVMSFFSVSAGIFGALCFNIAWEWQDGLKWQRLPTTTEAFNFADFLAGLIGIFLALVFRGELWQL